MESAQCLTCKNYDGFWTCKAFPKRIPSEIATGEFDHRKPYKGDNGIRYEPQDNIGGLMDD